jgi:hypothetical protein
MRIIGLAFAISLLACGSSKPKPGPDPGGSTQPTACEKGGCSGTVCAEHGDEVVTTCEYKPEYGCYKAAICERQPDSKCGWTQTAELTACLANPPPM